MNGRGRPRGHESDRRLKHFAALVASGMDFDKAADEARVDYRRALRELSTPEMRQVIVYSIAA